MENRKSPFDDVEDQMFNGRIIVRRFTDQLTGADDLERSTKAAQAEIDEEHEMRERQRLELFFKGPENSPKDFEIAEIARVALQETIDKLTESAKPSMMQRIGISPKSTKTKTIEVLTDAVQGDFESLKASIDNLEKEWKAKHGRVHTSFMSLCKTLDNHKRVFAIFPSQNIYTSVFCASLSCLMTAAKTHGDIAETLSKAITRISTKVATCSGFLEIIRTPQMKAKLADIYARMFQFYQDAIEWYLASRVSRAFQSFNENLNKKFPDALKEIDDYIHDLVVEAQVSSTAMQAVNTRDTALIKTELARLRRNYSTQDPDAGHRMREVFEATLKENKFLRQAVQVAAPPLMIEPALRIQDVTEAGISRTRARTYGPALEPFIIGDEGPRLFGAGYFWCAEEDVIPKLRTWMAEDTISRTLWVSSPDDAGEMTSGRAAALSVVAAAWQAESPLISHFCQRPRQHELRAGMTMEQVGLIGLVYSLIHQLLQFSEADDQLDVSEASLAALKGGAESWAESLDVLRALLDRTPLLMFCVIDSLDDLEWRSGREWCLQLWNVLHTRQQRVGTVFHILLTTAGQSMILPSCVHLEDRHISTAVAGKGGIVGTRIQL
ncbi:hypothetical protein BKA56DRAFT_589797 [Ilyonectria sp. MPI-CAGE-AT-0026]|nr:hypothetical protein BKA56DRAFT_589797 [Ilyonectria sp. MPI-CAGE-AT-0026]